ncbi:MAG: caspase family protein [Ignavibacteriae bacterium]|nr:caspase family protein [Ignavibacteriota bacterium]NOG99543.1 caspase family protein [Ignavibacteriota bacterium]
MKKIVMLLLFLSQLIIAQKLELKSEKISLDIRFAPPDSIPPKLMLEYPLPNIIPEQPIFTQNPIMTIRGKVTDNSNRKIRVMINGENPDSVYGNRFSSTFNLKFGENRILIRAIDKKKNVSEHFLNIYQDPLVDITPPKIVLTEPNLTRGIYTVEINDMNKDSIIVRGNVIDKSSIYALWINGKSVNNIQNGIFSTVLYNVDDALSVIAIDAFGNRVEKNFPFETVQVAKVDTSMGNYHALLIAVEEYDNRRINDLSNPVKDAEQIKEVLTTDYTFFEENVRLLTNPTRAEILAEISTLKRTLTERDNLLIFYAGHGKWDPQNEQGYWWPKNANPDNPSAWISNPDIRDNIRGIKSKHTLLIADACFSGGIFESRNAIVNAPLSVKEMYAHISRRALTSGMKDQEVPDESVFIKYIIKRLKENEDEFLSTQRLYDRILDPVTSNSANNQYPQYGVIQQSGHEGGDFVFIRRNNPVNKN